jgi:nucleoside 2-deoxyribosyltransferase
MRIYLSGAFVGSSDWETARRRYELLGSVLSQAGFEVYLPHTHTSPVQSAELSAKTVFERDKEEIFNSEILLALLDEPSHGVGAEIALALNHRMITIGTCHRNRKVSRFIKGLLESSETGEYFEYEHLEEIVEKVASVVEARDTVLCE